MHNPNEVNKNRPIGPFNGKLTFITESHAFVGDLRAPDGEESSSGVDMARDRAFPGGDGYPLGDFAPDVSLDLDFKVTRLLFLARRVWRSSSAGSGYST